MRFLLVEGSDKSVIEFSNQVEALEYTRKIAQAKLKRFMSTLNIQTTYHEEVEDGFRVLLKKLNGTIVYSLILYKLTNVVEGNEQ